MTGLSVARTAIVLLSLAAGSAFGQSELPKELKRYSFSLAREIGHCAGTLRISSKILGDKTDEAALATSEYANGYKITAKFMAIANGFDGEALTEITEAETIQRWLAVLNTDSESGFKRLLGAMDTCFKKHKALVDRLVPLLREWLYRNR